MKTSSKSLSTRTQSQLDLAFRQMLADLTHPDQVDEFCQHFFSSTERAVFAKRLGILLELSKKKSYKQISKKLKVSSATIASTSNLLEKTSIQKSLDSIHLQNWAEKKATQVLSFWKKSPAK